MRYWVFFFFVLASFRSDDGEVTHTEEPGHWCSHELHRALERLIGF